jgi:geranyl-CoA carboxylase alpha subunit
MIRLRGSCQGETYSLEIARRPGTDPPEYKCLITGPGEQRVEAAVALISRVGSRWTFRIDGRIRDVVVSRHDGQLLIDWDNRNFRLKVADPKDDFSPGRQREEPHGNRVTAPLAGKVISVARKAGEKVETGQVLAAIEAMKMVNQINAPRSGTVSGCHIVEGQVVRAGDLLFELE